MMKAFLYLSTVLVLLSSSFALETASYGRFSFKIDPSLPQTWVMVVGVTGTGKSSFIRRCLGNIDTPTLGKICHGLEPCTQEVIVSPWYYNNVGLFLVDTPGFDDPHRTDEQILSEIAEDISGLYKSGISIGAVIYLQRMSDDRLTRASLRSISALREIVGGDKFPSLVLVTTRWEQMDQYAAVKKEIELKKRNYWGSMIKAGAKVMRHDATVESAQNILDEAISRATETPLKIQSEMATHGLAVEGTSAMLAIESFDFFEKMQNAHAKGTITDLEYMQGITDFIQRRRKNSSPFWQRHAPAMRDVLLAVAQTALTSFAGDGVEGFLLRTAVDVVSQYFGSKSETSHHSAKVEFEIPRHYDL